MLIKTMATHETTWDALKRAADEGNIRELLHSGDQILVALKNGENIIFDVAYDKYGNLFFVMHDCMGKEHVMNNKWTNAGGWPACDMRRYLNSTVFDLLPDDLQAVIKPTTIKQVIDGETVICEDKLFLLSRTQVFGKGPWTVKEPDDTQLDIFLTERDRVKLCGDNGTWFWWLRSANGTGNFNGVSSSGGNCNSSAHASGGVALGFCI